MRSFFLAVMAFLAVAAPAGAHPGHPEHDPPPLLRGVEVNQRLGSEIPGDLSFTDESGKRVALSRYFGGDKPVILSLNYFECPQLCPLVLKGVSDSLQAVKFDIGREFEVVTVSIDPRETPKQARDAKQSYVQSYRRPGAREGWHFLTGDPTNISQLAKAIGFKYNYDPKIEQFAHPSAIMFVTPQMTIARYLFGISFNPRDVQFALQEASQNKIGSIADKVAFSCYQFDPQVGRYSFVALTAVRAGGIVTLALMGGLILASIRRERRRGPHLPAGGVG